ncbi:helix-turn-helix domain-containing protein [Actinomadura gamaensis]|uniref:Helix-turn-helix domain-containing protein n=1 Tax=Actinomadura gamaensis TaxID=1763541 RepID=A0ABV9TYR0_9ACTN
MARQPSTLRMRRLGAQLRRVRTERGLTLEEACVLLKVSKSALQRMESAHVIVRRPMVEYMLGKYGVTDADFIRAMDGLASGGRSSAWIRRNRNLVPEGRPREAAMLLLDSSRVRTYHPDRFHGLLQTPDYARAILASPRNKDAAALERGVAYRMARKEPLHRGKPVELEMIVGEAAIRQHFGGPAVMAQQLRHLAEAMQWPNVQIRIVPFTALRNPALDGGFDLLDVELGDFTVAVLDSFTRVTYLEEDQEIAKYEALFDELLLVTLSLDETRSMIEHAVTEFEALARGEDDGLAKE